MTSRERVIMTLEHKEPDRIPLDLGSVGSLLVDEVYFQTKKLLGIHGDIEPYRRGSTANYYDERILEALDIDFRHVWLHSPDKPVTDEWGITWSSQGSYPEIFPLKEALIEDLEDYSWPFPEKTWDLKEIEKKASDYHNSSYAVVAKAVFSGGGILERCCYLRTIDQFFIDFYENEEFARFLIEKVTEVELALWDMYLDAVGPYIDIFQRASDLGTQLSMFISPELFRKFLKPYEMKVMSFIKSKVPQAKCWFHSCGAVADLIEDFIEMGVEILNPVQPSAAGMNSYELKKRFGNRICFHGGIDIQKALPGSLDDVKREAETRIRAFGPGGGYILAPANHVQKDTPPENILMLYRHAKKKGTYPIKV